MKEKLRAECSYETFVKNFMVGVKLQSYSLEQIYDNWLHDNFWGKLNGRKFIVYYHRSQLVTRPLHKWLLNQLVLPTILQGEIIADDEFITVQYYFRKNKMSYIICGLFVLVGVLIIIFTVFNGRNLNIPICILIGIASIFILSGAYFWYIPDEDKVYLRQQLEELMK